MLPMGDKANFLENLKYLGYIRPIIVAGILSLQVLTDPSLTEFVRSLLNPEFTLGKVSL
jgi:hypothetical protein